MDTLSFERELIERVTRLVSLGAMLWVDAGRMRYEGPGGVLRSDDKAFFSAHRDAVVAAFTEGMLTRCKKCGNFARIRLDARRDADGRPDKRFSDLWAGECMNCSEQAGNNEVGQFSQAIAALSASGRPLIESELVN